MAITLISTVVVGAGGAASIDFTSIPGTYTDLMVVMSARNSSNVGAGSGRDIKININASGIGTSITNRILYGNGSTAASATNTTAQAGFTVANDETASTFSNNSIYFPNYAGATNKSFSIDTVHELNATGNIMGILAGLWSNTAAITSLSFTMSSGGNFQQYSSATLYGITKGSSSGVTVS